MRRNLQTVGPITNSSVDVFSFEKRTRDSTLPAFQLDGRRHLANNKVMTTHTHQEQEIAIFARLFQPDNGSLSPEAARSLLAVEFTPEDSDRMHELAGKSQEGNLSEQEQDEADSYAFVGNVLGILHSKARRSLKNATGTP